MRRSLGLFAAVVAFAALVGAASAGGAPDDAVITGEAIPAKLSDFGFFTDAAARQPASRVVPYKLNTALFSDYAEKFRYAYVPTGTPARYDADAVFDFPVGSALIKSFGYTQSGSTRLIETRVLLRRASGWVALPYVWNADGTEAMLKRGGTRVPVTFTDPSGTSRSISYAVPNQNQCKGCHDLGGAIMPIGPKARNLNDGKQLAVWTSAGLLDRAPADAPRLARWDDPAAPLGARATAYLEVNCAHCHNAKGPASNSGLFLDWKQPDPTARGIGKHPVAAGRGSGNREVAIDPGKPGNSILLHRMASIEPGVAMPELGRATAHDEAIAMLTKWIAAGASESQVKQAAR